MSPTRIGRNRLAQLNALALLGRALHDIKRGRNRQAIVYLGLAMVALKYTKLSFLLQGLVSGRRLLRPLLPGGSSGYDRRR